MLVSNTNKPLPEITDQTRPFWTAAKNRKLVLQKCARCGTTHFQPKPWCVECGCRDIPWTEAATTGTIYTFTVSRAVAMNLAGWQDELPVLFALIDLDDGARLYGQVTGATPETIRIGGRVEAYFEDISDEAAIPKFRMVG
jgi:uncharacterized OB-fold protein